MTVPTIDRQAVTDWVNQEIRNIEEAHNEFLDHKAEAWHDALQCYNALNDDTALVALIEDAARDAMIRLRMPDDAYVAEFGQEAADITNDGIRGEIVAIDAILAFLRN